MLAKSKMKHWIINIGYCFLRNAMWFSPNPIFWFINISWFFLVYYIFDKSEKKQYNNQDGELKLTVILISLFIQFTNWKKFPKVKAVISCMSMMLIPSDILKIMAEMILIFRNCLFLKHNYYYLNYKYINSKYLNFYFHHWTSSNHMPTHNIQKFT